MGPAAAAYAFTSRGTRTSGGAGEQPDLPVADLPAQKPQHLLRVGADQPLALVHAAPPPPAGIQGALAPCYRPPRPGPTPGRGRHKLLSWGKEETHSGRRSRPRKDRHPTGGKRRWECRL